MEERTTILCLASYEKGHDFLRECKRQDCRVLLLTVEKLAEAPWPHDCLDQFLYMPALDDRTSVSNAVSYLARTEDIARIVALDEFDLEMAAFLREHLRVPGMGETAVRSFRDKLVMRQKAAAASIRVPDFSPIVNHADLRDFLERVPPPWVVKPRTSASAIGIRKLDNAGDVWRTLDELGDRQSHHLIERFVPGDVFHVDSIVFDGDVRFAEVHGYATPPFDVMHSGGLFSSRTLPRDGEPARWLRDLNRALVAALEMQRGVLHSEFIRARDDGAFHFLETAARVGGANIAEMVDAATGINLWREWARTQIADARGLTYALPDHRADHAGVLISLARQEWPDTSAYTDAEIVWRLRRKHHAGIIVAAPDAERVRVLLDSYMSRFYHDFHAALPAPDSPTS